MERWTEFQHGNRKEIYVSIEGWPKPFRGIAKVYHPKKNETGIIIRIPVHDQETAEWFFDHFEEPEPYE